MPLHPKLPATGISRRLRYPICFLDYPCNPWRIYILQTWLRLTSLLSRFCPKRYPGGVARFTPVRALARVAAVVVFAAISTSAQTPATPPPDLPDAPGAPAKSEPLPTGPTILFDTSMGRLTCKAFDKQTPNNVANFIGLAEGTKNWTLAATNQKQHGKPYYNGLTFHRVIPGFMVQAGDPVGDGTGDPGFYVNDEIVPNLTFSVPGRLAMANSGPNTNGSQFFITEVPVPDLDGRFTIIGQCDAHSVLLAASIARVPRNASDKPLTPVILTRVTIVREGQPIPPDPAAAPAPAPHSTSN
jgi:peptidyl-prolyl cis-trans isomerase A (cyclophilin A)